MKRFWIAIVGLGLLVVTSVLILSGRNTPTNTSQSTGNKVQVAVSIYPVEFLLKTVAGDLVAVESIIPSGVEPHDYEPNTSQMKLLETADVVFVIGGNLEPWAVNLGPEKLVLLGEKYIKENDPHVWLDPLTMSNMAADVANKLADIQPQNRKLFENNLAQLQVKLNDLDTKIRAGLKSCQNRNLVVSHDAFGYLTDRYALTQTEISGLSHEDEPSPRELADIAIMVKQQNIEVIFLENMENPGLTQTLATETGAKILPLSPLEILSSEEINNGDNYLTVMEKNLENLRMGLGCN